MHRILLEGPAYSKVEPLRHAMIDGLLIFLPTTALPAYIRRLSTTGKHMDQEEQHPIAKALSKPQVGTPLAVASGLSFFFLCMILPLVGPAGSKVAHAAKNKAAFLGVLTVTFVLAAIATYSKMARRKEEGGALPYWSMGLCMACILTLLVLLVDGFAI